MCTYIALQQHPYEASNIYFRISNLEQYATDCMPTERARVNVQRRGGGNLELIMLSTL